MAPTKQAITDALEQSGWNKAKAARQLGVPVTTLKDAVDRLGIEQPRGRTPAIELRAGDSEGVLTVRTKTVRTIKDALTVGEVDQAEWEVDHYVLNKWDSVSKGTVPIGEGAGGTNAKLLATELWQVKIWLRRKTPQVKAMAEILEDIKANALKAPKLKRKKRTDKRRRALEVCIADPHLGLECFRPGSDHAWSLDECEQMYLWSIDELLKQADGFGPFDEIAWVFGHDFLHADNVFHTTTAGTGQPDMVAIQTTYKRGVQLAIAAAEIFAKHSPLRILVVPGNHDRMLTYTLGHVLDAHYCRDPNVTVVVDESPYKFWSYGVNLLGFDHGHSIKLQNLPALMANETRLTHWESARYCEWHLGDQHRKGGGRPTAMTEQGVGIEFLAGLTPANEWHKLKSFNWQARGAVAYVWDFHSGPTARLHANLDSYTGKPMGEKE